MPNNKNDQDHLLDHSYDGIQEFDNPMPRWWVYIFWATIIFSVVYWLNVPGIGTGKGRIANYEREMAAAAAARAKLEASQPGGGAPSAEQLTALTKDAAALDVGKQVYAQHCAACHGPDGGGQIGPNLTDDYWLHGASAEQVYKTVADGVLEKGMPPWRKVLKPAQLDAVVAYVLSIRGSSPANPKPPQGDRVTP